MTNTRTLQLISLFSFVTFFAVMQPVFAIDQVELPQELQNADQKVKEGVKVITDASDTVKTVVGGLIIALIIISFVYAILLRTIPNREWKEKSKNLLFDNIGTVLLMAVAFPLLLVVLDKIKF